LTGEIENDDWKQEELMEQTKPYRISKIILWNAYGKVRQNGGAAGIDGMGLEKLAEKEKDHLYKLWNRMSSGSCFPSAVLRVEIPKKSGGMVKRNWNKVFVMFAKMAQQNSKLFLHWEWGYFGTGRI
jgi:retron-type reverse transcriptase